MTTPLRRTDLLMGRSPWLREGQPNKCSWLCTTLVLRKRLALSRTPWSYNNNDDDNKNTNLLSIQKYKHHQTDSMGYHTGRRSCIPFLHEYTVSPAKNDIDRWHSSALLYFSQSKLWAIFKFTVLTASNPNWHYGNSCEYSYMFLRRLRTYSQTWRKQDRIHTDLIFGFSGFLVGWSGLVARRGISIFGYEVDAAQVRSIVVSGLVSGKTAGLGARWTRLLGSVTVRADYECCIVFVVQTIRGTRPWQERV